VECGGSCFMSGLVTVLYEYHVSGRLDAASAVEILSSILGRDAVESVGDGYTGTVYGFSVKWSVLDRLVEEHGVKVSVAEGGVVFVSDGELLAVPLDVIGEIMYFLGRRLSCMIYDGYMRSVPGVAGAGTCKWRIDVGRVGSRIVSALLSELCGESDCRVDVELFPLIVSYSGDARLVETSWGSINWGAYLGLGDPYNTILPLVDANHVLPLLKRLERVYGILEENYRIILVDARGNGHRFDSAGTKQGEASR